MLLHLVRHAIAAPGPADRPDAARPLTAEGQRKFVAAVRGMQRLGWRLDVAYHSPLVRAVQTAELLHPLLDGPTRALAELARAPDGDLLARVVEGERVALVGHEPYLSALAAWLVTGEIACGERIELKKGGVAVLAGPLRPGAMTLRALIAPKIMRTLGA